MKVLSSVKEEKNDILQQLQLPRELLKEYHEKLKNYRYINNIDGLESGHYIRWINLKDIEKSQQSPKHKQLYIPPINKGGYLCEDLEEKSCLLSLVFMLPCLYPLHLFCYLNS